MWWEFRKGVFSILDYDKRLSRWIGGELSSARKIAYRKGYHDGLGR